jgi:hypothetical protein
VQAEVIEDVDDDAREPRDLISKPFVMARTQVDSRWWFYCSPHSPFKIVTVIAYNYEWAISRILFLPSPPHVSYNPCKITTAVTTTPSNVMYTVRTGGTPSTFTPNVM